MPYIKSEDRKKLLNGVYKPKTAGELNFLVTTIVDLYLKEDLSYNKINEVVGVLECAKLELYRRIASPYEDNKIAENGDVYQTKIVRKSSRKKAL